MSTLKADAVTSAQDNTALTLSGTGTGGVKVNDFLVQTKGSDIASDTALTLGKDGNQFDVTGTTTITSIATQGIGSIVTLHFDGALTFTHHSTNLILPGAANITTATGDIAVMYEYASADWRCVSYTKASGAAVVAGGFTLGTPTATTSGASVTIGSIPSGTKFIAFMFDNVSLAGSNPIEFQLGDAGGIESSGYTSWYAEFTGATLSGEIVTRAFSVSNNASGENISGVYYLSLANSSTNLWALSGGGSMASSSGFSLHGNKALSGELTQVLIGGAGYSDLDLGQINISYM